MELTGISLIDGTASGPALRLTDAISFWGGVDPTTACITLGGHPQEGACITGKILAIPQLVGSSSSSAVLLELLYRRIGPAALVLGHRDAILPIGALVAAQMDWSPCPVVVLDRLPFTTGQTVRVAGARVES